jgi:hypothetical protein
VSSATLSMSLHTATGVELPTSPECRERGCSEWLA